MGDSNITRIEPLGAPLDGAARVPGDKSISHRAVLFAAMAEGTSRLTGVLDSADVRSTIGAVSALGAKVSLERQIDGTLAGGVTGWGAEGPKQPEGPLTAGTPVPPRDFLWAFWLHGVFAFRLRAMSRFRSVRCVVSLRP